MTHFFAVRDPGRCGGSWLARCCNDNPHPDGIVMLGEIHSAVQLDFPIGTPSEDYDKMTVGFLESQRKQGRAAVGLVKGFHGPAEIYLRENGARFATLVHHPLEMASVWKGPGRRGWGQSKRRMQMATDALGHYPPADERELFICLCYELRGRFAPIANKTDNEPIIRIEDLNRSVGGDGIFFQAVCEWLTRVPFPFYYIDIIRKWFLPGNKYPLATVRDEQGVVRKVISIPYFKARFRQTWADDSNPAIGWHSWTDDERALFLEYMQDPCEKLGYNVTDNTGYADVDWPQKGKYPWAAAEVGLKPIPPE